MMCMQLENIIYLPYRLQLPQVPCREPRRKRSNILSIDSIDSHQTGKSKRLEIGDEVEEVVLDSQRPNQVVRVGMLLRCVYSN